MSQILDKKTDDHRILLIIFLRNPRLPVTYLLPDPINELSVESKVANCFFTVVYRVANKFSDRSFKYYVDMMRWVDEQKRHFLSIIRVKNVHTEDVGG